MEHPCFGALGCLVEHVGQDDAVSQLMLLNWCDMVVSLDAIVSRLVGAPRRDEVRGPFYSRTNVSTSEHWPLTGKHIDR